MKKTLITAFVLSLLSLSAFAESKAMSTTESNDTPQISHFGMKTGWTCGTSPITFDCSLSKNISKGFKNSKI